MKTNSDIISSYGGRSGIAPLLVTGNPAAELGQVFAGWQQERQAADKAARELQALELDQKRWEAQNTRAETLHNMQMEEYNRKNAERTALQEALKPQNMRGVVDSGLYGTERAKDLSDQYAAIGTRTNQDIENLNRRFGVLDKVATDNMVLGQGDVADTLRVGDKAVNVGYDSLKHILDTGVDFQGRKIDDLARQEIQGALGAADKFGQVMANSDSVSGKFKDAVAGTLNRSEIRDVYVGGLIDKGVPVAQALELAEMYSKDVLTPEDKRKAATEQTKLVIEAGKALMSADGNRNVINVGGTGGTSTSRNGLDNVPDPGKVASSTFFDTNWFSPDDGRQAQAWVQNKKGEEVGIAQGDRELMLEKAMNSLANPKGKFDEEVAQSALTAEYEKFKKLDDAGKAAYRVEFAGKLGATTGSTAKPGLSATDQAGLALINNAMTQYNQKQQYSPTAEDISPELRLRDKTQGGDVLTPFGRDIYYGSGLARSEKERQGLPRPQDTQQDVAKQISDLRSLLGHENTPEKILKDYVTRNMAGENVTLEGTGGSAKVVNVTNNIPAPETRKDLPLPARDRDLISLALQDKNAVPQAVDVLKGRLVAKGLPKEAVNYAAERALESKDLNELFKMELSGQRSIDSISSGLSSLWDTAKGVVPATKIAGSVVSGTLYDMFANNANLGQAFDSNSKKTKAEYEQQLKELDARALRHTIANSSGDVSKLYRRDVLKDPAITDEEYNSIVRGMARGEAENQAIGIAGTTLAAGGAIGATLRGLSNAGKSVLSRVVANRAAALPAPANVTTSTTVLPSGVRMGVQVPTGPAAGMPTRTVDSVPSILRNPPVRPTATPVVSGGVPNVGGVVVPRSVMTSPVPGAVPVNSTLPYVQAVNNANAFSRGQTVVLPNGVKIIPRPQNVTP